LLKEEKSGLDCSRSNSGGCCILHTVVAGTRPTANHRSHQKGAYIHSAIIFLSSISSSPDRKKDEKLSFFFRLLLYYIFHLFIYIF
jgi:hypothetical protein